MKFNLLDYKFKENTDNEIISYPVSEMAMIFSLFSNDLKHIHLHAAGQMADTIHSVAGELYERSIEDLDTLSELAISECQSIPNYNDIRSYISQDTWSSITDGAVDFDTFVNYLDTQGNILLDYFRSTVINDSNNQSTFDDIRSFWQKQICYLNKNRMIKDGEQFVDNIDTTYIDAYQEAVPETEYDTVEDIPYEEVYLQATGR